ncbi:MAG: DUF349 domain-containing protein [Balneolaceae bacterium]|nr:MAG: DUF349 domain-containing protein [Balneolaceae bacterium]
MENEHAIVTNDGRILQKDNAIFQGKELAYVDSADAEEALRYFKNQFSGIEKHVETSLDSIRDEVRGPELLEKLQGLREEVISARAVGDFETLVAKIDEVIRECGADDTEIEAEDTAVEVAHRPEPVDEPAEQEAPDPKAEAPEQEEPEPEVKPAEQEAPEPEANPAEQEAPEPEAEAPEQEEPEPEVKPAGQQAPDPKAEAPEQEEPEPEVKPAEQEAPEPEANPAEQEAPEPEAEAPEQEEPEPEVKPAGQQAPDPKAEAPEQEEPEPEVKPAENDKVKEYPESLSALVELADKAEEIARGGNWQQMQSELDNIRFKWDKLLEEDAALASETDYRELEDRVEAVREKVSERKAEWLEKRRERRKENLAKRAKIIDQLQDIIDRKKWQVFKQVGNLSNRWEDIKDVPNEPEAEEQEKKFEDLIKEFNEKKVNFLVRKAQKEEENLVGKLTVLDKLNQVISSVGPDTENWEQRDKEIEELSRQWRKIGHVPSEQSDTIWERFKAVRDEYFSKKMEYNKEFRAQTMKNIRKKTRLCELAEELLEEEDLAVAVREINNLHKKWKKIGPIPKEKNDELWDRFNEATKKFNERKSENLDVIREQEQENLDEKVALCEKAEALSGRTDWSEATAEMDALMKAWKEAGPIPRRRAGKLWKRFKKAMDAFYDARRNHFKTVRDEQKENYEKKKEIVAELVKLGDHENPEEAVQQAKQIQEKFRSIGFVPIKKKQKIEKEYKEACDRIYQRHRGSGRKAGPARDHQVSADKSIRAEYFKLKKECDNLHEEIMRYGDTKTFINPGGKGNDLIDEIQQKIDDAQKKLDKKQDKLEEIRQKMED